MARGSPIFIFVVIVLVAVSFVMIVGQMNTHTPTAGIYSQNNSTANQTGQLIASGSGIALNLMAPIVFISLALVLIGAVFLLRRH